MPGLDALVNNAGIGVPGPVEAVPLAEWRRQLEVNLLGPVGLTRALLPALLRARGRIVNVSSIGGRVAAPMLGAYSASKFALEAVTDALRREVGPLGIVVVGVEPGAVATPIWGKGRGDADAVLAGTAPEVRDRYAGPLAAVAARAERPAGVDVSSGA
jgi:NAD(P)-dependent dehydrogenase (short-subunit alcohol dehydrogenase family)